MEAHSVKKYKLAWMKGDTLHSYMGDTPEQLLSEAKKMKVKDFMIIELIKEDGDHYDWKLLDYGVAQYVLFMQEYQSIFVIALLALTFFFIFYVLEIL